MRAYLVKVVLRDGSCRRLHGLFSGACEAILHAMDLYPEAAAWRAQRAT